MGIFRGPNIVRDGLVFGYDANDKSTRYYPGEPTTNLNRKSEEFVSGTYYNTSSTWSYSKASVVDSTVVDNDNRFLNAYEISFQGLSHDMYRRFESLVEGELYSVSMYVKLGTATNFCLVVNNSSAWNTIQGQEFTSSDGLNTSTYVRVSVTFMATSTLRVNVHLGGHSETITQQTPGTVFLTGVQFEHKGHATQYLRNSTTGTVSRSATQGLLDLTGNTAIDLSNVSFDSTAHPDFDGTTDYISLPDTSIFDISSEITVESVVKYESTGGNNESYSVITCKGSPWNWLLENQGGKFNFRISTANSSDSNINSQYSHGTTSYHHVVATYNGATQSIYVNGELKASKALTGAIITTSSNIKIGTYTTNSYEHNGQIPVVKLYNQALSATEIKQNYNAYKNRFNL